MYGRILSTGSTVAALATLLFVVGSDVAQAARCPQGEIYRPSRGICVSKERAIQAGIYRGAAHSRASLSQDVAPAIAGPDAKAASEWEPAPARKPRPQAMAAIEREAPIPRRRAEEALAFIPERQPEAAIATTPIQPETRPVVLQRRQTSPFGSLVALEPLP